MTFSLPPTLQTLKKIDKLKINFTLKKKKKAFSSLQQPCMPHYIMARPMETMQLMSLIIEAAEEEPEIFNGSLSTANHTTLTICILRISAFSTEKHLIQNSLN